MSYIFSIPGRRDTYKVGDNQKNLTPQNKKDMRFDVIRQLNTDTIPFHAALVKKEKTLLICGPSKSGKSTLSEQLKSKGYTIHANDFVAVWKKGNKLFAGDINFETENRHKKPISIDFAIFLNPDSKKDIYRPTYNQAICLYRDLFEINNNKVERFINTSVLKEIIGKSVVVGNRKTRGRWLKIIEHILSEQSMKSVGIIGFGTVGSEAASLLLTIKKLERINLYSPNKTKLIGEVMDLRSANPNTDVHICHNYSEVIQESDAIILTLKSSQKEKTATQERTQRIKSHLNIIWDLTRQLRKNKYRGYILVVTNPVDILSSALYYYSNMNDAKQWDWGGLLTNQVLGIGIGLDYQRLRTFTNTDFELVGEHGENILLTKKSVGKLRSEEKGDLLQKVKDYSPKIRKYTNRTKFGPAHEIYRVFKTIFKGGGIIRVSTMNEYGTFLGDVLSWQDNIPQIMLTKDKKVEKKLETTSNLHKDILDISFGK